MIKAVLIDLDGTLLGSVERDFISAFLEISEQHFIEQMNRCGMRDAIRNIMHALRQPRPYNVTNADISREIIEQAGFEFTDALQNAFTRFYESEYQKIKPMTWRIPGAEVVMELIEAGYTVVIATNPIYPAAAIQQRLSWAGLPDDFSTYAYITTSENMHAIKPDPTYYAEILARVGIEPSEAIMVGNSPVNDIEPARTVGLTTYLVNEHLDSDHNADRAGTTEDFLTDVRNGWLQQVQPHPLHPQMIAHELRGNVNALFGMLSAVKPHQWTQHPDPDEWSILQIVCHLLERETNLQRPRLQRILNEDNPFLSAPAVPTTPSEEAGAEQAMSIAHRFAEEREKTLTFINELSDEDWQRPATHSIFSNTTLLEMAHFTAQHDRMHITQICQTLGKCN